MSGPAPADDPVDHTATNTEVMVQSELADVDDPAAVDGQPDAATEDEPVYTIPGPDDVATEPVTEDEPVYTIPGPDTPPEVAPTTGSATLGEPLGDFRLALVASVSVDLPNQHPTVVLRETESPRRQLSFSVGLQDGMVLSHALRRIPTPRPLTHELLSSILQGFDVDIVAVRLVGRQGAVYFAELDLRGRTSRSILSCRPSDGLTLALLQPVPVPILIDRRLLEQDGDVVPPGPG